MASALYEYMVRSSRWEQAIESGGPQKWGALRELYAWKDEHIKAAWPHMSGPYPVDWKFTPIEAAVWQTIRTIGLPLYPQYPVGPYFVDFADPVRKLAIECDGAQWHDAAKDAKRDEVIRSLGWRVRRYTGRQCYLKPDHPESIDAWLEDLAEDYYRFSRAS